jgi:hypothetical protein
MISQAHKIRKALEELDEEYHIFYRGLGGACAIASYFLTKSLESSNMCCGYYKDDAHCWVTYNNQLIDITFTQFEVSAPKVLITSNYKHYVCNKIFTHNQLKTVKKSFKNYFKHWGEEQNPIYFELKNNKIIWNSNF